MARMNSTSLYITTNQLILKSDPNNPSTWQDLYRLAPYLRNSLCCVVCGNLLIDPLTPEEGKCQHHLCRKCKGGRKKIKPACTWCKDCDLYTDNKTLRILLQCYKKMCMMLTSSEIFRRLTEQASQSNLATGVERGAGNLIMLIKEGAAFQDDYEINVGLSKSVYSILPCIYTNSSTQTLQPTHTDNNRSMLLNSNLQNVTNGNTLYSVMYAGAGNKLTIKRTPQDLASDNKINRNSQMQKEGGTKGPFKKPTNKCLMKSRRGCRCGNATATPGKLTCCGQRCPCYVENKPCMECKCRGCRNPHLPDGNKVVRAHTSHLEIIQNSIVDMQHRPRQRPSSTLSSPPVPTSSLPPAILHQQQQKQQQQQLVLQLRRQPLLQNVDVELDSGLTFEQLNEHLMVANIKVLDSFTNISSSLPHTLLVNDAELSDNEDEEVNVEI